MFVSHILIINYYFFETKFKIHKFCALSKNFATPFSAQLFETKALVKLQYKS